MAEPSLPAATTRSPKEPAGRLRIVHCFRAPVGGVFRHIRDLTQMQRKAGHSVGIICDSTTGGDVAEALFKELEPSLDLGLKRFPMRRQVSPADLIAAAAVYREVRTLNPDIMHGHGAKGGAYARMIGTLLRASGVRVARIYTPHGGSLHYDPAKLGGWLYLRLEHWLEHLSDGLIFVSQYEQDTYAAKVGRPRRPTWLVRNGLEPTEFEPVEPTADARQFVFVGELRDLKGPDVFIDALARLRDRTGRPATAILVGSGDPTPYRARADRLGIGDAVAFRGPMPARAAFALGQTLVVPSRAESMPYVVLEAAAAAIPLIAADVGGIREIVPERQLVPPADPSALADAMAVRLADPDAARRTAAELRRAIEPNFNLARMAAGVETAYRQLTVHLKR